MCPFSIVAHSMAMHVQVLVAHNGCCYRCYSLVKLMVSAAFGCVLCSLKSSCVGQKYLEPIRNSLKKQNPLTMPNIEPPI